MKTFQDATKKYKVREQIEKTEAVAMVGIFLAVFSSYPLKEN